MKILSRFSNNLTLLNKPKLAKLIREVISYNNIEFDEKMMFSSTSFFSIKDSDDLLTKEAFPLKLFIPDFILENFSLHDREQKKIIINFLKIFINEIIFLSYYTEISRKIFFYTFKIQEKDNKFNIFSNKRGIILLFESYFKEKVTIKENTPKKVKNNKQFILGENCIYSKRVKHANIIGENFYTFLNRISVNILIHSYELSSLKGFLNFIGINYFNIIFSCPNKGKVKSYKFNFIFEKDKCISIFTLPN